MGNTGCNKERKTQRWMDGLTPSTTRLGVTGEGTNDRGI